MAQSVEPQIADLAHGWLKQYELKYYIEQDAPNSEIKNALLEYESKQGGTGGNRHGRRGDRGYRADQQ